MPTVLGLVSTLLSPGACRPGSFASSGPRRTANEQAGAFYHQFTACGWGGSESKSEAPVSVERRDRRFCISPEKLRIRLPEAENRGDDSGRQESQGTTETTESTERGPQRTEKRRPGRFAMACSTAATAALSGVLRVRSQRRKRGKALLGALIELLLTSPPRNSG